MADERRCPRCGAALPGGGAGGDACRRCLLALGLGAARASEDGAAERVGPFRTLDALASADESVTWLAEADDGRRVALRVLDPPEDSAVPSRLEAERKRLQETSHPAIVRRVELGELEDGRPWIATEWVAGVPVTELCDRECLTLPRRLELMVEVCEAMDDAHAAGALHLDLRPSRVLVALEEGRPRPRIVGCGVEAVLAEELTEEVLYASGGVPGEALGYAAPERLQPKIAAPDARADVYALGAMLYELLTGALPFDPWRLRRARWDEILRILREEAAPRPSARVASLPADVSSAAAARRGLEAGDWIRALRGDLDWILLKAVAKDPAARHPSPGALGRELARHLAGEPVAPGWRSLVRRLPGWLGR